MKELQPLLEKLADKLGTTAEQLWAVLIVQAGIEAQLYEFYLSISYVILGLSLIFFVLNAVFVMFTNRDMDDTFGWSIAGVFCLVVGIISGVINYEGFIVTSNNPEYWALNEILKHL